MLAPDVIYPDVARFIFFDENERYIIRTLDRLCNVAFHTAAILPSMFMIQVLLNAPDRFGNIPDTLQQDKDTSKSSVSLYLAFKLSMYLF